MYGGTRTYALCCRARSMYCGPGFTREKDIVVSVHRGNEYMRLAIRVAEPYLAAQLQGRRMVDLSDSSLSTIPHVRSCGRYQSAHKAAVVSDKQRTVREPGRLDTDHRY